MREQTKVNYGGWGNRVLIIELSSKVKSETMAASLWEIGIFICLLQSIDMSKESLSW